MKNNEVSASLTVGQRIRKERRLRGMTQAEFSHLLGISVSYLGAIERGERGISSSVMGLLHEQLGLSYDYLLDGTTLNDYSIQQYLRETPHYGIRHNLDVILGACSNQELENCYDMLHTYLIHSRRRKRRKGKNPSSEQ
ncbi:anaerobic benzoate catabolism transcriptional regulator [Clostridiales bacterium CHKCI001]|nr:anaerobic benzoate catabolism transcriptional regulator [Clostridiales bacterium CHKCI001]